MVHDAAGSKNTGSNKNVSKSGAGDRRFETIACVAGFAENRDCYDAGVPEICPATDVNVVRALFPTVRTAVKQMTMISDNITAYSTAVGPSSDFRKRCTFE
jgi:hypothetical protein